MRQSQNVDEAAEGDAAGAERESSAPDLDRLGREIAGLRRTLLRHGHAQELFQSRVERAVARLENGSESPRLMASPQATAAPAETAGERLRAAQLRTLIELGQAVRHLRDLAGSGASAAADDDAPRSLREGLDLLEIRVSNLQRSFDLVPIPTRGRPFDDRLHRVHGVCRRDDLPDGQVVEEVLPGYLLGDEVERPALVIVNRLRPEVDET